MTYFDKKKEAFDELVKTITEEKKVLYNALLLLYRQKYGFGEHALGTDLYVLQLNKICRVEYSDDSTHQKVVVNTQDKPSGDFNTKPEPEKTN